VREDAVFPEVLRPQVRSVFADVREGKLQVWKELERAAAESFRDGAGLEMHFDLIYGPNAWEEVWLALGDGRLSSERDLVFLHTGGAEGNCSMLDRFCFKGLLDREEARALLGGVRNSGL
jgi:1-aminocyclopropane-1-carboxylate deaminase/D-cysteine desulfhydrase-like pyridoxal-dependent ACC family enzyme